MASTLTNGLTAATQQARFLGEREESSSPVIWTRTCVFSTRSSSACVAKALPAKRCGPTGAQARV